MGEQVAWRLPNRIGSLSLPRTQFQMMDGRAEACAVIAFKTERYLSDRSWHHDCTEKGKLTAARFYSKLGEIIRNRLQTSQVRKTMVRIAVIDSDPMRFVGFRVLLGSESDFELESVSLTEIGIHQKVDVVLVGRQDLDVIVTGRSLDDAAILKAFAAGAKGCLDEAASVGEFVRAIRTVLAGSVWAPRRVLAMFVEQASQSSGHGFSVGQRPFTIREQEVLRMLVAGCTNKDIATPLGIAERTVKAHIAKLLQKVGVSNRVMLSMHAITHSLVVASLDD
jgi:DNA-binding CsgD family transcriptional regulator